MSKRLQLVQEATIQLQQPTEEGQEAPLPQVQMEAYTGAPVNLSNYDAPVVVELSSLQNTGRKIPLLMEHTPGQPVGHGTAQVNDGRLELSGVLSADKQTIAPVVSLAKNGFPWQSSIGVYGGKVTKHRKGTTVNGTEHNGPIHVLRGGVLREVSLVSLGADNDTTATIAANIQESKPMATKPNLKTDFTSSAEDHEYETRLHSMLSNEVRTGALSAEEAQDTLEDCLENRPSLDKVELELVRGRRAAPSTQSFVKRRSKSAEVDNIVAECAFATFANVEGDYSDEVRERAHAAFPRGLSLGNLLNLAARANGYSAPDNTVTEDMLMKAMPPSFAAASSPSTYRVSGILSNVANKAIVDAFMYVEQTWSGIANISSVRDFKQISTYALTGDFKYKKITPAGEITHADLGEVPYVNKADTYARMFAITRHDLINDDLGAFDRIRTLLGRGAALQLNEIFWTEYLADVATFWSVGNANLISGANTALSIEAVGEAYALLDMQTDPDGNPMGSDAAILLCTPKNRVLGMQIVNDTATHTTDASTSGGERIPAPNPWAGMLRLVVSRYLQSASIPNSSADHWWLLADPNDVPTVQVVFLNGRRTPVIEQASADFNQLGIQLRGYHDFGVAKQEYRGSVRATGVA